jgi:hypothetical protein
VSALQVHRDRVGAGIQPRIGQVLADLDDLVLEVIADPVRARPRSARAWLESCLALGQEPPDELVHPPPGHPVVPGHHGLGSSLDQHRRDHQPRQRHRPPPWLEV